MATEKRDLIDRRRLLRDPYFQEGRYPESNLLRMAIGEQPTVDAVEVVRGQWLINSDGYYPYCSECGEEPQGRKMTRFCPNCGAKMDGDGNG